MLHPSDESVQIVVKPLTPALASALLANRIDIRPITESNVSRMCSALRSGRFEFTGEAMQIIPDGRPLPYGRLANGSHRCTAVVRTGITIPKMVFVPITDSALAYIDTGKKRTLGNTLHRVGAKSGNVCASIVSQAWAFDNFPAYLHYSPDNGLGEAIYLSDRDAFDNATSFASSFRFGMLTPKLCGWLMYVTEGRAEDWLQSVVQSTDLAVGTGAWCFNRRIVTELSFKRQVIHRTAVALMIKAYTADCRHKKLRQLKWSSEESFPDIPIGLAPKVALYKQEVPPEPDQIKTSSPLKRVDHAIDQLHA